MYRTCLALHEGNMSASMKLLRPLRSGVTWISVALGSSSSQDSGGSQGGDAATGADAVIASDAASAGDGSAADGGVEDSGETDSGMTGATDGGLADSGSGDVGPAMSIPDPGAAMDDWGSRVVDACCSTPGTAYPVGVVTMNSGYVQGNIDPTLLEFFYVFKAGGALTQFTWIGETNLAFIDLHDGTGLVYGSIVPATNIQPSRGTWNVNPGQIYVLHLHATAGGFF
jgi:hypothetical protein